jgi:hypothetical protein
VIWKSQYICCRISTWFHSAPSACVSCNVFFPSHELDNFDCWLLTNVWFEPGFLENAQKSVANVQAKFFFFSCCTFYRITVASNCKLQVLQTLFFLLNGPNGSRRARSATVWGGWAPKYNFFLWKVNPDQLFNSHLFLSIYVLPRDACWQGGKRGNCSEREQREHYDSSAPKKWHVHLGPKMAPTLSKLIISRTWRLWFQDFKIILACFSPF